MVTRPSVLCPVDFSDASKGALRYAAALAEHFFAELTVLSVDNPLVAEATAAAWGHSWMDTQTRQALEQFVASAFPTRKPQVAELRLVVRTGQPAAEILRVAGEMRADVIVMSTHGASGPRKAMFGSVAERVLRETRVPVIVAPATDVGPDNLEAWKPALKTILAPIDFTNWTPQQVRIARGLAEAMDARLIFAHVLEPLPPRFAGDLVRQQVEEQRRERAHQQLSALIESAPPRLRPTMTIAVGDPATEIARIARQFEAGAIVIGLHSAPEKGYRMGTVTYRLLCQAPALVVAWPPASTSQASAEGPEGNMSLSSPVSGVH